MVQPNNLNQHIVAVLESIGWPEDAFMPIANDENRNLLESIEQQMKSKKMLIVHRDQLSERVELLNEHHQNAQIGLVQNLVRENRRSLKAIDKYIHRIHFAESVGCESTTM